MVLDEVVPGGVVVGAVEVPLPGVVPVVEPVLAALTVASACSGGNSGNGAGANATVLTPHPKSVTVTLDGAKAATAMMPVTGGKLSATGSDGSEFTLTIPDKALAGPEKVSMTPLNAVHGLPHSAVDWWRGFSWSPTACSCSRWPR